MNFETQISPATKCDKPAVIGWFLCAWVCGHVCEGLRVASVPAATNSDGKKLAYNAARL